MFKLFVLGVGVDGLTGRQKKKLATCGLVVCAKRFLPLLYDFSGEIVSVTPLTAALKAIRQGLSLDNVGILAGGDPLFFGIGRRLSAEFEPERLEFYPAVSLIQAACARFKIPWDDAALLSLHGRSHAHVPGLLLARTKSLVLTDGNYSPARLAGELLAYLDLIEEKELATACRVIVAENIGLENENIFVGSLAETVERDFAHLNVFCLQAPVPEKRERLGLTVAELAHSRGLISKDEVRAVTLHSLRLPLTGVFWDVGAGSGSISIEAARLNPDLVIYAVEQKKEELANIRANIRQFGCYNVIPQDGKAPGALAALPEPQRVFIGGSGGKLPEIIKTAAQRLAPGGRLVANGVIRQTIQAAPCLMVENGLKVTMSKIQVERGGPDLANIVLNPITIILGKK